VQRNGENEKGTMKMEKQADSRMENTAHGIVRKLRAAGHVAYYAGGSVRDLLRGQVPKDIDVATDARPEAVQKMFSRTYAVGAHFGVIVVLENGFQFEIATFRSDGAYLDGRRPSEVHFATAEEDAARRDFTINGMLFDPEANAVIDFVDGRADLEARLIRAIGDPSQRFAEDRLRILRAVRFATVLGFEIEPSTWEAVVAHAPSINEISAERIREELVRIFTSPQRVRGWDLLDTSGLMRAILPEVEAMKGCDQPPQFHPEGDVFKHTRIMLDLLPEEASLPLVFSVLFHDIGKPATSSVDENGRIRFNGHDRVGAEMGEVVGLLSRGGVPRQGLPGGRGGTGRAALVEQQHPVVVQCPVQPAFPPARPVRAEPGAALQEQQPRQIRRLLVGGDDLAAE